MRTRSCKVKNNAIGFPTNLKKKRARQGDRMCENELKALANERGSSDEGTKPMCKRKNT